MAIVFFLSSIRATDKDFSGLFGRKFTDDEHRESQQTNGFAENYGWIFNAEKVAEHQRIKLNEVWELSYVEFLNSLVYIKAKNEFEREEIKKVK